MAESCQKTRWQVHAWCLMSNHYHLVVETPEANPVDGMALLQSAYTIRLNDRHKLVRLNPFCLLMNGNTTSLSIVHQQ